MKQSVIPDDITPAEAKALVLTTADYCQKHQRVRIREVFNNFTTGKWCAVSYCPQCREEINEVIMEFQMAEPLPDPPALIEFNVLRLGVQK